MKLKTGFTLLLCAMSSLSLAVEGPCAGRKVAFTFDDGPNALHSPKILETLKTEKVPATFFTLASQFEKAKTNTVMADFVKQVDENELFDFANHTGSHLALPALGREKGADAVLGEIKAILKNEDYKKIISKQKNDFFRAPYGATDPMVLKQLNLAGYKGHVYWHVDTNDWNKKINPTPEKLRTYTLEQLRIACKSYPRKDEVLIVLMHDIHANSAAALSNIIKDMKAEKVEFAHLDEIRNHKNSQWKPTGIEAPEPSPSSDSSGESRGAHERHGRHE